MTLQMISLASRIPCPPTPASSRLFTLFSMALLLLPGNRFLAAELRAQRTARAKGLVDDGDPFLFLPVRPRGHARLLEILPRDGGAAAAEADLASDARLGIDCEMLCLGGLLAHQQHAGRAGDDQRWPFFLQLPFQDR